MEVQESESAEGRAWLLHAAVAGMNVLADLADRQGADDLRSSFLDAAGVWAEQGQDEGTSSPLRLQ